ncbi:MAG: hypothetical protein JSS74_05670 [Actinobacteria bacterium]|nr:hypothetical protein [Actinomycetota bacterium]
MSALSRRAVLGWVAAAGMVAASAVLISVTPPQSKDPDPFVVTVAQGERGVGRNIDVSVMGVRRVQEITATPYGSTWSARGNWLVVDLHAAAVTTQTGSLFRGAQFLIDGKTYTATERIATGANLLGTSLLPGVPRAGSVAFELPAGLDSGSGTLAFSMNSDARADSQIRVPIDLRTVPSAATAELPKLGWAR